MALDISVTAFMRTSKVDFAAVLLSHCRLKSFYRRLFKG